MITNPLALTVQHKILGIAFASCLGAGTAVVAIASANAAANATPVPLMVSASSASSAVPVAPPSTAPGGPAKPVTGGAVPSGAGGAGATTATSPAKPAAITHPVTALAPVVAKSPARTATTAAAAGRPASSAAANTSAKAAPAAPAAVSQPAAAPVVSCPSNQRLTDAQITWLLGEVSKTAASVPSVAPGAAQIEAQLQSLLGQRECATQAQPVVTALCSGSATRKTINAMASQMPFLVRLVVGNPCSANLSSLLPKLSSYTSML